MKNRWDEENLKFHIKNSKNKSEVLKKIGLKPFTGNYDTLNKYILLYDINITHFTLGFKKNNKPVNKISLIEILISGSTYQNTTALKKRLYKEELKQPICELCGQDEIWNHKKMSLILDHINGIHNDNRLENLRIVCPNCNATLPTHCGKNRKNKSSENRIYTGKICECGKRLKSENISGFCRKCLTKNNKSNNYCKCGKKIKTNSKSCEKCNNIKQRKLKRPPHEQLQQEVIKLGYSGTGRKYGVSDNAIRKWLN